MSREGMWLPQSSGKERVWSEKILHKAESVRAGMVQSPTATGVWSPMFEVDLGEQCRTGCRGGKSCKLVERELDGIGRDK